MPNQISSADQARKVVVGAQIGWITERTLTVQAKVVRLDLLQNWKNGAEYIFMESKDDVNELASFMKANEMDGTKSVHFVFANSPPEGPQTTNHIAINVSGFSNGFDAFQKACA